MKVSAFTALSLLCIFGTPLAARADGITAGIAITGTHGTHQEPGSTVDAPFIAAPVFVVDDKQRQIQLVVEGLPPIGPIRVENNGLGIKGIRLGYGDASLRFWDPSEHVAIGIGESLYVQRTTYALNSTVNYNDASRVVGARYEVVGQQRLGQRLRFVTTAAVNPRLHAVLTRTFDGRGSAGMFSPPAAETGSQVDLGARIERSNGDGTVAFGVRYINYSARFDNGALADRNVFTMPFVSFGMKIGR